MKINDTLVNDRVDLISNWSNLETSYHNNGIVLTTNSNYAIIIGKRVLSVKNDNFLHRREL